MDRITTHLAILTALAATAQAAPQDELMPPKDAPATRTDRIKARQHLVKATRLYRLKKYEAALAELHAADDLDPEAEDLFAIAQVHVKLDHCTDAITYYQRFLESHPGYTATQVTKNAIAACKAKLPPPPPPPPPPKPDPPPAPVIEKHAPPPDKPAGVHWYSDKLGDGLLVAGAVSGIASLLAYRAALGDLDVADQAQTLPDHALHVQNAETMRTYALVLGGAAAALVTVGVVHVLRHDRKHERSLAVAPLPGGGMIAVGSVW